MTDLKFFDEVGQQSAVKSAIVTKYFWAWANVVLPTVMTQPKPRIAYIDLFAGPGRYKDGAASTPLMILERAANDPKLKDVLVAIFNDKEPENTATLNAEIAKIPGITNLKFEPEVNNEEVGDEIVKMFGSMNLIPTLFFVDPWGYKGLSLKLVNSVLKNWGCDCIFFFNYNRINMGLNNPLVKEHMDALFGEERGDQLRSKLGDLSPQERELTIVEQLAQALKEMGGKYVLPFRFKREDGGRTSHHLIFVSKHVKGYEVMKQIMAKESSSETQGVASFEYAPATSNLQLLFQLSRPLDELGAMLLDSFRGQTIKMIDIYNGHHVDTPYISRNYKDALRRLEASGQITVVPPAEERPKRHGEATFADTVTVTFPK